MKEVESDNENWSDFEKQANGTTDLENDAYTDEVDSQSG